MSTEIRRLLSDENALIEACRPAFLETDTNGSGDIDEQELYSVMVQAAKAMNTRAPKLEEVQKLMQSMDRNKDGRVTLEEFIELIKMQLRDMLEEIEEANEKVESKQAEEQINKQLQMFEKYLEESGITMAFQLIFAEILTKKIDAANVFTYTAMRLRQIGKEIAHLLPKNLTANISEHS